MTRHATVMHALPTAPPDAAAPRGPARHADWAKMLAHFKTLRELNQQGGLKLYHGVKLGPTNTVLLYEKTLDDERGGTGFVLTADGSLGVLTKAQFAALTKPR